MTYEWSRRGPLSALEASGQNGLLTFETPLESALVQLNSEGIDSVKFRGPHGLTLIDRSMARVMRIGEGNYCRDVWHFLGPGGPATELRLGYTKHADAGTWSSLPHDFEMNPEPGFEEVFFYLLQGGTQSAIQVGKGMWSDGTPVNTCWPVGHETFSTVPMGYHPVVGEPGTHVTYVWAYLCKFPRWEKVK